MTLKRKDLVLKILACFTGDAADLPFTAGLLATGQQVLSHIGCALCQALRNFVSVHATTSAIRSPLRNSWALRSKQPAFLASNSLTKPALIAHWAPTLVS